MSKNVDKNSIKYMASLAKKRLKSGFWSEVNKKREMVKHSESSVFERDILTQYISASLDNSKTKQTAEEDEFYNKAVLIIEEDNGLNSLGRLIDRGYYETLESEDKQRYVFELSRKYKQCVERYEREQEVGSKLSKLLSKK